MMKKKSRTRATPQLAVQTTQIRRAPLVRSAYWAWLVGGVGGAIWSASQVYLLHGGFGWLLLGALFVYCLHWRWACGLCPVSGVASPPCKNKLR